MNNDIKSFAKIKYVTPNFTIDDAENELKIDSYMPSSHSKSSFHENLGIPKIPEVSFH